MLVRCPSCTKKLKVDDARLTTEGTKFKCPGCAILFLVRKPAAEAPAKLAPEAPVLEEKPVEPPPPPPPVEEEKLVEPPPPPPVEESPAESRPPVEEFRIEPPPPVMEDMPVETPPPPSFEEERPAAPSPPPSFQFDEGPATEEQTGPQEEPEMGGPSGEQQAGDQPAGVEFRLEVPPDLVSEGTEGTEGGSLEMPSSGTGTGEVTDDLASFMSHTFVNQEREEELVSTEWGTGDSMQSGEEGPGPAGMDEMGGRGFMQETVERDAAMIQNPFGINLGAVPEEQTEVADTTVIDLPAAVTGGVMEEVQPPPPVEEFAGIPDEEIERARRLARTIMSDIALYNPRKVEDAIRSDNFYEVMSDDLRDGMKLYNSRIPPEVRAMSDFYREAVEAFCDRKREDLGLA